MSFFKSIKEKLKTGGGKHDPYCLCSSCLSQRHRNNNPTGEEARPSTSSGQTSTAQGKDKSQAFSSGSSDSWSHRDSSREKPGPSQREKTAQQEDAFRKKENSKKAEQQSGFGRSEDTTKKFRGRVGGSKGSVYRGGPLRDTPTWF